MRSPLILPILITNIHDPGITDTEYAAFAAKGYNPALEWQLIEVGEDSELARS